FGDLPTVKELIQAGAGVEVVGGMIGFTPLIWAAGFNEDPKVVEYLLSLDADMEAKDVLQGATPLMHAARTNMHENVVLLIKSGANLKMTDNEGNNALLMAAKNAGADAKMIGILIDAGCDLSAKDKNGMDALGSARKRSDLRAEDVVAALEQAYEAAGLPTAAP
ncbi:MAG: ankyrin repeat domain-containing protein, partial [Planctomycetota bacterium]|nr:ankyrin repeat domain-containing protein [Planctomycetota bacterium]